jgi:hypothetical protein
MPSASDLQQPFPVRRVHEVEPRAAEQRWLVDRMFARSSVALLGGPPKAFKTWLAAELALAVAAGSPAFGRFAVPEPGPVLFFGAEDSPADLRTRFDGIARGRGVRLPDIPLFLLDIAQLHLDDTRHLGRLRRTLALHAPRLLVLDPFVRLVAGLDENSAREVSTVLGALRTLQREHNVTILLVHHMRKSPAAHPAQQLRGSGDFSAWLDSGLYLTRDGDDRTLIVEHRYAPAPPPFRVRLVPGDAPSVTLHDVQATNSASAQVDPLQARVVERLRGASRPLATQTLRDDLRVRKSDLLSALRALADRRAVTKTADGWALPGPVE